MQIIRKQAGIVFSNASDQLLGQGTECAPDDASSIPDPHIIQEVGEDNDISTPDFKLDDFVKAWSTRYGTMQETSDKGDRIDDQGIAWR